MLSFHSDLAPRRTLSLTSLPLAFLSLNLSQELGKEDVAYINTTLKLALLMHKQVRLRGRTQSVH